MSTIGSSTPPVNVAGFDPVGGQVGLDDLQGRQGLQGHDVGQAATVPEAVPATPVDPGEYVLSLPAWTGVPDGGRQLARDATLEYRLGGLDRSEAANAGIDDILAAFGAPAGHDAPVGF